MKITKMLNMTRSHILRVIFCSIVTMGVLVTVGIVNRVYMYVFASWQIDIIENNLSSSLPIGYIIIVLIWNYIIGIVVICLSWKYLGFPKVTMIGKYYTFINVCGCFGEGWVMEINMIKEAK
ncbi:unnamed protein product [marine sediment metagenome]|uniref:Uncharacterized protein n=1 Tax=marine sediment metagenome TaxID=412755 RepID=X1BEX2_9ZZZZ